MGHSAIGKHAGRHFVLFQALEKQFYHHTYTLYSLLAIIIKLLGR